MGLDMFLRGKATLYGWRNQEMRDDYPLRGYEVELGYWRKHPNLHGYIVREFADGKDECQEIELSAQGIEKIIAAVEKKELPHTEGFFFGASDGSEDEETIKILRKALMWLAEKPEDDGIPKQYRQIVYLASW